MDWNRPSLALLLTGLLTLTLMPSAEANPAVPYCPGSVGSYGGQSLIMPEVCEAVTGRVFPEASPLSTPPGQQPVQDFVSFFEFQAGLEYIAAQAPDYVTVHEVAQSYGLCPQPSPPSVPPGLTGACAVERDTFPVYVVEITNKQSPVPMEERLELLFMLSIHGVEKGGREGGFRVLEDLALGRGMALETVQNGAGLPEPMARPGGEGEVATYRDYLDFTRVFLLFPNPDGWVHDEAPYVATSPPSCGRPPNGVLFCRTNGNGTDLNRQVPTIGWQRINEAQGRLPVNEPEARGYINWLIDNHTWNYAIDIHGMLNHENFLAVMMPAGSFSPQEMLRSTRLAETLKERTNNDPHFDSWRTLMATYSDVDAQLCEASDMCPSDTSGPLGSGEFADWGTVWDAIGYTDSGFSGDFFAQTSGLNAPGYDIEMAYNHVTVDSQYEGAGALFNDYHVHSVRHIVKSFMDAAALDVKVSLETHGSRTAYVQTTFVATNSDDEEPNPGGWADENPADDSFQYTADKPFTATPLRYWLDMKPFVRDGSRPGVLDGLAGSAVSASRLADYDTLVIPGSAVESLSDRAVADIRAWVEAGGNLVLTDQAITFFDRAGITQDAAAMTLGYAGAIDMDRSHDMTQGVRGFARQTYEPVPLGYSVESNSAPIWGLPQAVFSEIGGDMAGTVYNGADVTLGRVQVQEGRIQFIGALLPDPTEEFYHPYGLDNYATTYSGNQLLRNMLGWTEVFEAPPIVITDAGTVVQTPNEPTAPSGAGSGGEDATSKGAPGADAVAVLAVLAAMLVVRRRR